MGRTVRRRGVCECVPSRCCTHACVCDGGMCVVCVLCVVYVWTQVDSLFLNVSESRETLRAPQPVAVDVRPSVCLFISRWVGFPDTWTIPSSIDHVGPKFVGYDAGGSESVVGCGPSSGSYAVR